MTLVLAVTVDGTPHGMVCFALPPKETIARYGCLTWELARLYLEDFLPANSETFVVARAIKHIRLHHPEVKRLVSYADPSKGHEGIIYRAGNWLNDGMTDSGRKTPRFDLVATSTDLLGERSHRYARAAHVPDGASVSRLPRVSKHRYTYVL